MTRHEYVILGDVVASREIGDRESFRETIETALEGVNDRYTDDIVGQFAFVKGVDEIAGVIREPRNLYKLLRDVVSAARPGAIRFAVVYGEIDVGATGPAVGEMDGPAFHRADEALAEVADANLYVTFSGRQEGVDPLVTASLNLLLMARESWTDRQRAMVTAYEETGTQEAVADQFDVSQQAVSAALRRAAWPRLAVIEDEVNEALAVYAPNDGGADEEQVTHGSTEVPDGRS